jgi:hypothetical protein
VRVAAPDGEPLATLLHYTCHPVAAGHECRLVTADWCGVARQQLEAASTGPVLIVNGAGGDINPHMERRGFEAAAQTGRAVGAVALDLWQRAEPVPAGGVAVAQAHVPLMMAPPGDAAAIAALWAQWQARAAEHPPASLPYREAAIIYRDHARRLIEHHWGAQPLPSYTGEAQALRLGPVALVGLPGEFFSAYGLRLKAAVPAAPVLIAGWTNDNLGYFPTAEGMAIGGYEPDIASRYYGFLAPWSAAAGAAVTERAIDLLRQVLASGQ